MLLGILILGYLLKQFIDGEKEDNVFGKAANGQLVVIAIVIILVGIYFIS